jgi:hypothetical protein
VRADRHDEANSRFSRFCKRAQNYQKITFYEQPLRFVRDPKSGVASVASTSEVFTYSILVRLNVGDWTVEGSQALNDPSP